MEPRLVPKKPLRNRLMAAIHVQANNQGMKEDERRALQVAITGLSSCADMTIPQLGLVLDAIKHNHRPTLALVNPNADQSKRRMLYLITNLCEAMSLSKQYANGIARQMYGQSCGSCNPEELRGIITALNIHKKRREQHDRTLRGAPTDQLPPARQSSRRSD